MYHERDIFISQRKLYIVCNYLWHFRQWLYYWQWKVWHRYWVKTILRKMFYFLYTTVHRFMIWTVKCTILRIISETIQNSHRMHVCKAMHWPISLLQKLTVRSSFPNISMCFNGFASLCHSVPQSRRIPMTNPRAMA